MMWTDDDSDSDDYEISDSFLNIEYKWDKKLQELNFKPPIKYVYYPLDYAQEIHRNFVRKYFNYKGDKVLFVGMNPGPWGMAQTGVPFGDARTVKLWLGIKGRIKWFHQNLPNRVVTGLSCGKIDESGRTFWTLIKQLCDKPENFFKHCLIHNYCPLIFYTENGKVLTLQEVKGFNTKQLFELCDNALADIIVKLQVKTVVACGKFIEKRVLEALSKRNITGIKVGHIPHPSTKNSKPKYKENWNFVVIQRLKDLDVYRLLTEK